LHCIISTGDGFISSTNSASRVILFIYTSIFGAVLSAEEEEEEEEDFA